MNYIVDTHIVLWVLFSPKKISQNIHNILLDSELTKYVSIVTFWEIAIKFSLNKLELENILPDDLPSIVKKIGFILLNLDADTVSTFYRLPNIDHKDPFDRMLAWQAIRKNCVLLTKDQDFAAYKEYGLQVIW